MFKKGDRVRCIDNEGSAGFAASLTVGKEYVVAEDDNDGQLVKLVRDDIGNRNAGYCLYRFEKVEPKPAALPLSVKRTIGGVAATVEIMRVYNATVDGANIADVPCYRVTTRRFHFATGTVSETTRMCCEATLRELHAAIGDILGLGDE